MGRTRPLNIVRLKNKGDESGEWGVRSGESRTAGLVLHRTGLHRVARSETCLILGGPLLATIFTAIHGLERGIADPCQSARGEEMISVLPFSLGTLECGKKVERWKSGPWRSPAPPFL